MRQSNFIHQTARLANCNQCLAHSCRVVTNGLNQQSNQLTLVKNAGALKACC